MSEKKVIVIGAGIAGLSAGYYLSCNGFDTEVFEMHSITGGLCTAWKRKDYTIDYCVHWLMGTQPGTGFDIIWDELGAFNCKDGSRTEIKNFDDFTIMELSDGEKLCFYSDTAKLEKEMLRIAPEDAPGIRRFCRSLRRLSGLKIPAVYENWSIAGWIKYFIQNSPGFISMIRHMNVTLDDFASKWKSQRLREVFSAVIPGGWSLGSLTLGLAMQNSKSAGYPVGGSLVLAENIERSCISAGCRIRCNSRVEEIITENGKASGIRLSSGEIVKGDYVICASDGHTALYDMLKGKYVPDKLKQAYDSYPLFPSSFFIGIGIAQDLNDLPHAYMPYLKKPLQLPDGSVHRTFSINTYNFDPALAPDGKTLVTVLINTWNSIYWKNLKESDPDKYKLEKQKIADEVIIILDEFSGGRIKNYIETVDVSTPSSVMRYTGNWKGSYEGFAPTPLTLRQKLPKTLPGLDNFYMIGQWTSPGGGLPPAAKDGRDIAIKLCKREKRDFKTFV